jgi:predicted nuclease of restriction endonuclease-like (RecB) superfamily
MVILDSCADHETSEFYARRAVDEGWTRGALQAMIASRLHERSQPALTTFGLSVPEADREAVREIVKDPFILDFLMADPVRERDLSKALTDNLSRFLRELGTGFAFVGAEVPVQCGDREIESTAPVALCQTLGRNDQLASHWRPDGRRPPPWVTFAETSRKSGYHSPFGCGYVAGVLAKRASSVATFVVPVAKPHSRK